WNLFDHSIPTRRLFCAEVRAGENLLQANDLCAFGCGFADELQVFFNGVAFDLIERFTARSGARGLNESASNYAWHVSPFIDCCALSRLHSLRSCLLWKKANIKQNPDRM